MLASVPAAVMVLAIPGEVPLGGGQGDQKVKLLRVSSLGSVIFETRRQGPRGVQGKLLSPQDPLFGTRLFVCSKNWVLRA